MAPELCNGTRRSCQTGYSFNIYTYIYVFHASLSMWPLHDNAVKKKQPEQRIHCFEKRHP